MTEHKIKLEIPDCISKPIEECITPVTKSLGSSIGNTISVAWELAFGGLNAKLEKVKYKRQKDVESFKQELDSKINKIPLENLTEAEMHIVGPTLEASKYYFEKEDLRNMFSSLIASSVDISKSNLVHPSFVEIIKQLSSNDAQNIILLSKGFNNSTLFPIVNYQLKTTNGHSATILKNVLINKLEGNMINLDSVNTCSTSLVNLERLGLIYIVYDSWSSNFNYNVFTDTNYFVDIKNEISNSNTEYSSVDIQKGYVELTPLGINFVQVCL
ncbi:DUF4393 domain-containing protein [Clostridium perfringens]|uniref:DUF4393 domain-containing protein n=1 Tax=Clostridium perfringens TaxID=1502 RepID=UPI001D2F86C0|nr:DUF4393 domain-containing protein [Clostridium perfringens]EHK2405366.1 DUF4393 domain-containing protein [Clostridium perfringens]MDZ5047742.1 DUF4393 domain-containing protein [Clostridium perfringens]